MEVNKDSLLYAIDASPSMMAPGPDGKSSVQYALEAATQSIRERTLLNPNDNAGIIVYGVHGDSENCKVLLDLAPQNAASIKKMIRLTEDPAFLAKEIQTGDPTPIGDLFYLAGTLFETEKAKTLRRLVLVTNNDYPHPSNSKLAQVAKTRSYDLVQKNAFVMPVFISPTPSKNSFDVTKFWEDLYFSPDYNNDAKQGKIPSYPVDAVSVKAVVLSKQLTRRPAFHNHLLLGDIRIDVRGYNIFQRKAAPQSHKIFSSIDTQEVAVTETKYIVEESGRELEKTDMGRAYSFGNDRIPVSDEERARLHDFGEPSIRILGFQPREDINPYGRMDHSIFLYPWDVIHKGSTRAFISLWRTLLKGDKMALVFAILRKNSTPMFALLYATTEERFGDEFQAIPGGMFLVPLPYLDDMRNIPANIPHYPASDQLIDVAGEIIQPLTLKAGFDINRYENPYVSNFNKVLEAQALSREAPSAPIDKTLPKYQSINTRAGKPIAKFVNDVSQAAEEVESEELDRDEPPGKRAKISIDKNELVRLYNYGELGNLSFDRLQEILKAAKIAPKPRKSEMVAQLKDYILKPSSK